ncbi:MAG: DUF896 domain-containing protein [Eubacterium sp.]|jgi:Uncharacterized protein conserved in bacteria|nr:DUF896 domain-containing protein [Eubacterium sp.]
MIDDKTIARINELYHKSKAEGLTTAEKKEQEILRQEYVAAIRKNLKSQLSNIDLVREDGTVENLGQKHEEKQKSRKLS